MLLQGNLPLEFKESETLLGRFWRGEDLKKGKGEKEVGFSFSARRFFLEKVGLKARIRRIFLGGAARIGVGIGKRKKGKRRKREILKKKAQKEREIGGKTAQVRFWLLLVFLFILDSSI